MENKQQAAPIEPILDARYLNSLCEVISDQNDLLNYARVAEIAPGSVTLKPTREGLVLTALYFDTPVKINIYNTGLGFKVLSGVVGKSSSRELRVIDTQILIEADRRQFFRIRVYSPARLEPMGEEEPRVLRANLEDLSLCGLQFSTPEVFEKDSRHRVTFDLEGFRLSLKCEVKRIVEMEARKGEKVFGYGCSLMELRPNEENVLHKLLLRLQQQRRARERG